MHTSRRQLGNVKTKVIIMPLCRLTLISILNVTPQAHALCKEDTCHLKVKATTLEWKLYVAHKMKLLWGPAWDRIHTGAFVTTGKSPGTGRQQGSQETNRAANQDTLWITLHSPLFNLMAGTLFFCLLHCMSLVGKSKGDRRGLSGNTGKTTGREIKSLNMSPNVDYTIQQYVFLYQ